MVTVNIAGNTRADMDGIDRSLLSDHGRLTLTEWVIGKLFADRHDAGAVECDSITVVGHDAVRVVARFDASEFIAEHLCGTEGCGGDADAGDSYAGFCADCADQLYGGQS